MYMNDLGQMIKMAVMPMYGKNLYNSSFVSEPDV